MYDAFPEQTTNIAPPFIASQKFKLPYQVKEKQNTTSKQKLSINENNFKASELF